MTRFSCHRFRSNQVRLALSLLASSRGNLWRRLALPQRIENWLPMEVAKMELGSSCPQEGKRV